MESRGAFQIGGSQSDRCNGEGLCAAHVDLTLPAALVDDVAASPLQMERGADPCANRASQRGEVVFGQPAPDLKCTREPGGLDAENDSSYTRSLAVSVGYFEGAAC